MDLDDLSIEDLQSLYDEKVEEAERLGGIGRSLEAARERQYLKGLETADFEGTPDRTVLRLKSEVRALRGAVRNMQQPKTVPPKKKRWWESQRD